MKCMSVLTLSCAVSLVAPALSAGGPSAADRATARQLAQQGHDAIEASDYGVAIDRFSRAYELVHAPTILLGLARAETSAGHLLEAFEAYNLIIREGLGPHAPKPFQRAYEDAHKEMAALATRLCWVIVVVKGPAVPNVSIDDALVPRAALGVSRAVNPGTHKVQASGAGFVGSAQSVRVAEGETLMVTLDLERERVPAPVVAVRAPLASSSIATGVPGLPNAGGHGDSYIAFGVGGAALITGVVTGLLAMKEHNRLDDLCPNGACSEAQRPSYQRFSTLSLASTIGFAVGLTGVALGGLLYLGNTPRSELRAAHVEPFVGYPIAGVRGAF